MEERIIYYMSQGYMIPEISKELKRLGIKPNSVSFIEKSLNKLRKDNNARTNFELAVVLERKNKLR